LLLFRKFLRLDLSFLRFLGNCPFCCRCLCVMLLWLEIED
jgi:hypothetical protein